MKSGLHALKKISGFKNCQIIRNKQFSGVLNTVLKGVHSCLQRPVFKLRSVTYHMESHSVSSSPT